MQVLRLTAGLRREARGSFFSRVKLIQENWVVIWRGDHKWQQYCQCSLAGGKQEICLQRLQRLKGDSSAN